MVKFDLRLNQETIEQIKKEAEKDSRTVSAMARKILEDYFKPRHNEKSLSHQNLNQQQVISSDNTGVPYNVQDAMLLITKNGEEVYNSKKIVIQTIEPDDIHTLNWFYDRLIRMGDKENLDPMLRLNYLITKLKNML